MSESGTVYMKHIKGKLNFQKRYTEGIVRKWLKKSVEEAGGVMFKNHPLSNKGIPDDVIHINGKTYYVETKTTGDKCTPIQLEFHKILDKVGIQTFVLDVRIDNFYDLFIVGYKTYVEGDYEKQMDFRARHNHKLESKRLKRAQKLE